MDCSKFNRNQRILWIYHCGDMKKNHWGKIYQQFWRCLTFNQWFGIRTNFPENLGGSLILDRKLIAKKTLGIDGTNQHRTDWTGILQEGWISFSLKLTVCNKKWWFPIVFLLFQGLIFRCHVSFREGNWTKKNRWIEKNTWIY